MKLFMVIYIFGKVAGTIGPLPYDMAECHVRAAEKMVELDEGFAKNPERSVIDGKKFERKDIELKCLESEEKPANEHFAVTLDKPEPSKTLEEKQ